MKISAQNTVPTAQNAADPQTAPAPRDDRLKRPAADVVGKRALHDPLRQLRDNVIETSAHASHLTAKALAEGLKFDEKLGKAASIVSTIAEAAPQFRTAYGQDGLKLGGSHVANVAADTAAGAIGGYAVGLIGSQVGEVAGAFVGGALYGVGAIPGAMIGDVIGGAIGGYIGSKMALDDLNSSEIAVSKHHG